MSDATIDWVTRQACRRVGDRHLQTGRRRTRRDEHTILQHFDILAALRDRNPQVAEAAALLHVATT